MVMEIDQIKLTGRIKWAKVHEPVLAHKSRDKYQYEFDFEVTEEVYKKLLDKGMYSGTKLRDNCDGEHNFKYMKFRRPVKSASGADIPPLLVVSSNPRVPFTDAIGNYSKVNVAIDIIHIPDGGSVIRPSAIQVVELVEYNSEVTKNPFDDGKSESANSFDDKPEEQQDLPF